LGNRKVGEEEEEIAIQTREATEIGDIKEVIGIEIASMAEEE